MINFSRPTLPPEERLWMTVVLQAYADKNRRHVSNGIASASISGWIPMAQRRAELFLSNSGGHLEYICDLCGWEFSKLSGVINA